MHKNNQGQFVQKIHIITTGGTIDKRYAPKSGDLYVGEPIVSKALSEAGVVADLFGISEFLQKDSLEITKEERADLARLVAKSSAERILITHGTDTMRQTAMVIDGAIKDKTVVLTGAFVPGSMDGSDARFNIGGAFVAAQILPPGVYIAMNGRALPYEIYKKYPSSCRFLPSPGHAE